MSARTVVGSWPSRQALPEGREALERALRLCEGRAKLFRHRGRRGPAYNMFAPVNASDAAYRGGADESVLPEDVAGWLPERYRDMSVTALREELRKLDEVAP